MVALLAEGLRLASGPTDKVSASFAPALPFSSIFRFQKVDIDRMDIIRLPSTAESRTPKWSAK